MGTWTVSHNKGANSTCEKSSWISSRQRCVPPEIKHSWEENNPGVITTSLFFPLFTCQIRLHLMFIFLICFVLNQISHQTTFWTGITADSLCIPSAFLQVGWMWFRSSNNKIQLQYSYNIVKLLGYPTWAAPHMWWFNISNSAYVHVQHKQGGAPFFLLAI